MEFTWNSEGVPNRLMKWQYRTSSRVTNKNVQIQNHKLHNLSWIRKSCPDFLQNDQIIISALIKWKWRQTWTDQGFTDKDDRTRLHDRTRTTGSRLHGQGRPDIKLVSFLYPQLKLNKDCSQVLGGAISYLWRKFEILVTWCHVMTSVKYILTKCQINKTWIFPTTLAWLYFSIFEI